MRARSDNSKNATIIQPVVINMFTFKFSRINFSAITLESVASQRHVRQSTDRFSRETLTSQYGFPIKKPQSCNTASGFHNKMPGSDLLSHGETPHYHWREEVSLLSSRWDQVVHSCYCRQTNWLVTWLLTSDPILVNTEKYHHYLSCKTI